MSLDKPHLTRGTAAKSCLLLVHSSLHPSAAVPAAGALKRLDPDTSEELIMYRTMLDLIKPKLVFLDLPLFMALLSDLFPGVDLPPAPVGSLRKAIEAELQETNLQASSSWTLLHWMVQPARLSSDGLTRTLCSVSLQCSHLHAASCPSWQVSACNTNRGQPLLCRLSQTLSPRSSRSSTARLPGMAT